MATKNGGNYEEKEVTKVLSLVTAMALTFTSTAWAQTGKVSGASGATTDNEKVFKVVMDETGYITPTEESQELMETGSASDLVKKPFSWDNATVYFVLTDRFLDSDESNNHSYGRGLQEDGKTPVEGLDYKNNPGTFHGGDLNGLTQKVTEGYFNDLGVNAIWITAPYEQIHGYTSGNKKGDNANQYPDPEKGGFPYYSYHGYWALDYTNIDANMGTADDFEKFVDSCHERGIRVVMDIVMNHVGYATMYDAQEYGFSDALKSSDAGVSWKSYYFGNSTFLTGGKPESQNFWVTSSNAWANWWGPGFVRADYPGYTAAGGDEYHMSLSGLPDVVTEKSASEVPTPPLLVNKWKGEGRYDKEQKELEAKRECKTDGNIELKPVIISEMYDAKLRVEFYIGSTNGQFYKIKSLSKFYDNMIKKEKFAYSKKFEFIHVKEAFSQESIPLLNFLMKYAELLKYANENSTAYMKNINDEYIILTEKGIDDFFEIENGKNVSYKYSNNLMQLNFIDKEPNIQFRIVENGDDEYAIETDYDIYQYTIINGEDFTYFLDDDKIYRCSDKFKNNTLKILNTFRVNFTNKIPFKKEEFSEIYSLIIPKIKENVEYKDINEEEIDKYIPKKLKVKLFLDTDKNNYITCDVMFCYDNIEFNPLTSNESRVPRNIVDESRALDDLKNVGFMYDANNAKLIIANEDDIYNFLKDEINNFISKYEVLATNNFYNIQIIKPKTKSIGVKVENNLLNIDMTNIDFDKSEIDEIMKKYVLKKRFHRLRNGQFIDLEENSTLDMIENVAQNSNASYEKIVSEKISLPIYRSFYLDKLLKKSNIVINQNSGYSDLIDNVADKNLTNKFPFPKGLNANLREYQKVGYEWLRTLDEYGLGGILADDMGLGKTVQVLSVILSYVESSNKDDCRIPSLVICPSSLSLNWEEETKKFAPSLKTLVINGDLEERKRKIDTIKEYDLVIISYDLLKRDIELFEDRNYNFRYLIADEAQYIKN